MAAQQTNKKQTEACCSSITAVAAARVPCHQEHTSASITDDKGAAALAEMLKSNTTLERLDLSSNVIDYDGISAISAALVENTCLKALYVRCACRHSGCAGTKVDAGACEQCSVHELHPALRPDAHSLCWRLSVMMSACPPRH